MSTETEREQKLRERIERELTAGLTGYDVLVQTKKDNVMKLFELIRNNPNILRTEIAEKLGVSLRTTSRYLVVVKKVLTTYKPVSEVQVKKRSERMRKMDQILARQPSISVAELAGKLGVSSHTIYKYFKMRKKEE